MNCVRLLSIGMGVKVIVILYWLSFSMKRQSGWIHVLTALNVIVRNSIVQILKENQSTENIMEITRFYVYGSGEL